MMSKHPLELPVGRKLSREEIVQALRLSIIAELDAINLYLQLAGAIDDEKIRKVFEDIAKEEKTHVGEFLALLKVLDEEQVTELEKGAREIEELTGLKVPNSTVDENSDDDVLTEDEFKYLSSEVTRVASNVRIFRKYISVYNAGKGVDAVPLETIASKDGIAPVERIVIPLHEFSVKFVLSQKSIDYARSRKEMPDISTALQAATKLAIDEDSYIAKTLLSCKDALRIPMGRWEEAGVAIDDVTKALQELVKQGITGPYVLFVSPDRYAKLLKVYERVTELERLKSLVKDVVQSIHIPGDMAILISANPYIIDVAVGVDTEVNYIGPENGNHVFRIRETIALRIKNPKGIVILEEKV